MSSDDSRVVGSSGRHEIPHERRRWLPLGLAVLVHAGLGAAFWWGAHDAAGHSDAIDRSMSSTTGQDATAKVLPPMAAAIDQSTAEVPVVGAAPISAQETESAQKRQASPASPEPVVERVLPTKPAPIVKRYASVQSKEPTRSVRKPTADKKQMAAKTQPPAKKERVQLAARGKEATNKPTIADKKRQQRTLTDARQMEQLREAEMRRITSG